MIAEIDERVADVMVVTDRLPDHSCVHNLYIWENRILIRPFTPEGKTESGLWVTKNSKWARIWGHVLAVPERTLEDYPDLRPGAMLVFKRYAEEAVGEDVPLVEDYLGERLPVDVIHVDAIECVFDPPLRPVRV